MDINELESFKLSDAVTFHKELNPKLWQDDKLDPEVRDQLMLIAEDFVEYLGIGNLKVKDVTISGSNAAYSYTPHSDLDLHVLVDFNDLPNNEVYQELFTAKKTLYNDLHDISVRGVPVELYVQDTNQDHISLGEYSIVYDKWIRIPKKRRANFDEAATKLKYEKLGDLIELALQSRDPKRVKATIDLVKRYRKAGLDKAGEFGPENLAFKAIRKQGLIQDLYDLRAELHGEKLSIEEENQLLDKPTLSVAEIADKHGVNRMQIANELDKGIKVELEHTNDKSTAREIALDHLAEDPAYYSKLSSLGLEEDIGFKSWKNPTPRALYNLTKRSKFGNMRGLYHEGDTYWWDADNAIHSDGAKELGIPYDYQSRMLAAIDSVSGNYRVGGADHVPDNVTRKYDIENDLIYESSLMETTEESQLINLISKRAAKKIFKMFRKEPSELVNFFAPDPKRAKAKLWGISANELGVPYIKNPVLANVLNHVKFIVSNKPDSSEKNTLASYNKGDHDIVLHYPVIKKFSTIHGYSTEQYIAKSIAHELQHAVDNFKSAGKTFVTKKSAYNTQPYEINARFQEALMNITNALDNAQKEGKTVNPAGLPKFIAQIFEHNDISQFLPKDGRRYKQLVKRAYKFFEAELNNPKKEQPLSIVKRALNYIFDKPTATVNEASGYIPSEKEKNDPRFKTALTIDVKPDSIEKNAKAFNWKTSRSGIPPQARADGKIAEDLMREWKSFLAEEQQELFPGYDEQHKQQRLDNWLKNTHAWDGHKPRVFYHATTKDFDTFNTHGTGFASVLGMAFEVERHGSFFAVDPKFAEEFIQDPNRPGKYKDSGRVIPVYLSVQNPIDLRDSNLSYMLGDTEAVEGFEQNGIDLWSIYRLGEFKRWELFDGPEGEDFVNNLQKLGFDGAIITELPLNDDASGEVWVAFNPNQIKSIHNRGSFSPDDPNLMKENG